MSIADDLEKVLFGVADKWCQGTADNGNGYHCLVGWTGLVERGHPYTNTNCETYLNDFLSDYTDYRNCTAIGFNDSHTHQEVIWMLEEAIDDARERGL
jgi:hypothetical protein